MGGTQKICAACGSSSGSKTSGGKNTSSNAKEVVKRATSVKKNLAPEEVTQKSELKTARSNETKAKTKAAKALAAEDAAPGCSTESNATPVKTEKKKKIVDKKKLSPEELEVKAALKAARSKRTKDATKASKSLVEVVEVEVP